MARPPSLRRAQHTQRVVRETVAHDAGGCAAQGGRPRRADDGAGRRRRSGHQRAPRRPQPRRGSGCRRGLSTATAAIPRCAPGTPKRSRSPRCSVRRSSMPCSSRDGALPVTRCCFLTHEATIRVVSDAMTSIAAAYRISMPAATVMRHLMDKAGFRALAEDHGYPVPRAVVLRRAEDLAGVDALDYPCVLKPVVRTPAYERRFKRAYKIQSPTAPGAVPRDRRRRRGHRPGVDRRRR
jgi:hypothetical protein